MVIYKEDFRNCTDECQPYQVQSERTHYYTNYDGIVENQVFLVKRNGVRQLLLMPETKEFDLSLKILYTAHAYVEQNKTYAWGICFGYSRNKRAGYQLVLAYTDSEHKMDVTLFSVAGRHKQKIEEQTISDISLSSEQLHGMTMELGKSKLTVCISDKCVCFDVEPEKGIIALSKEDGLSPVGFSDLMICGAEEQKEKIWKQSFSIPKTDGGANLYELVISIFEYKQTKPLYEITYELKGGMYKNDSTLKTCDCWLRNYDQFWGLYFSLGSDKYYIFKDRLVFSDNDFKHFKEIFGGSDIPYCGSFCVDKLEDFDYIFIGYDMRESYAMGNLLSERMFAYNKSGKLIWIGKPMKESCFLEVRSNAEKEITKRIPEDCVDYEEALFHAKNNHYFINDEIPEFWINVYSKADRKYLEFSAELQNTWFEKIDSLNVVEIPGEDNIFVNYGYKKYCLHVKCSAQKQGVYHLKVTCRYGNEKTYEHTSAFEVLEDSLKESPQQTAQIPNIFCGDGAAAKYSTLDFASQQPDCNIMHYVDGSLHNPEYSEKRRFWELTHLYHRKLFIWMTRRTLKNNRETYKDYPETIKNADYLNYLYPGIEDSQVYYRYDTWNHSNIDAENVKKIYAEFLEENPELKNVFPPICNNKVDEEMWGKIPGVDFEKWVTYINKKVEPLFEEQWKQITELNPNVKRFAYGPYNVYVTNHSGAYDTKWYGFSGSGLKKAFKGGFMQFEDYPFACGYKTHISAWNMATIKQKFKDLRIAPEMYDSFTEGCPDGAVSNANPPRGGSYAPPYQTVTQLYEYLYNTAIYENGAFRYWDDRIVQMYDFISYEPQKRYQVFLKAWKLFLDNKPQKPHSDIAYITEYDCAEDGRTREVDGRCIYNKSQVAESVVREVNAEMGYPQGFVINWDSILGLNEKDVKLIVVPSLRCADQKIKDKIRELYNSGVALIAGGNVDGLEDIFGVKSNQNSERVDTIRYENQTESIEPYTCTFAYEATTAKAVVTTENNGVIFKNYRALLINASLGELGVASFGTIWDMFAERANISKLVRKAIKDYMKSVLTPIAAVEDMCGLNIITTEKGETILVLTDYSPYSNKEKREVNVSLNNLKISSIENLSYDEHEMGMNLFMNNGMIDGFSVEIRPRETLIFKVK